ncbi:hypothetical protein [Flavobacterium sp.]
MLAGAGISAFIIGFALKDMEKIFWQVYFWLSNGLLQLVMLLKVTA